MSFSEAIPETANEAHWGLFIGPKVRQHIALRETSLELCPARRTNSKILRLRGRETSSRAMKRRADAVRARLGSVPGILNDAVKAEVDAVPFVVELC
jgi:hypothetical protein